MVKVKREGRKAKRTTVPPRVPEADAAKRERSLRACTRCRARKQRCDNALPHCSNCIKGGVACEAFPINVVSRENLLQLYDQLQDSTRRNNVLQEELDVVRLVNHDPLSQFSALVAHQASNSRAGEHAIWTAQELKHEGSLACSHDQRQERSTTPALTTKDKRKNAALLPRSSDKQAPAMPALEGFAEILGSCFPAVAPAVCLAVSSVTTPRMHERANNVAALASLPMQELYSILAMRSGLSGQAAIKASTGRMEASVKETANTLFAAADMTRVAAIMLWTLLALVKRRVEDLLRLDKVLTGFMKVWQNRAAAEASALLCDVMTIFYRAYSWIHLQTAITGGSLQIEFSSVLSLDAMDASRCKLDMRSFASAFQVEVARLEYQTLCLFSLPTGCLTDMQHAEAVWTLLTTLKQLSDVLEQRTLLLGAGFDSATPEQDGLLRSKLAVQLYGVFPRLLARHNADRRLWRWLANAGPLAATALSLYHFAWAQIGWLGDHALDAATLADLLAAFAWIHQQQTLHNDSRPDQAKTVEAAIELGEHSLTRWPQLGGTLTSTLHELRAVRECAAFGAPLWPCVPAYSASSSAQTSSIRTPTGSDVALHPVGWPYWASDDASASLAAQIAADNPWCEPELHPAPLRDEHRIAPVLVYMDEANRTS